MNRLILDFFSAASAHERERFGLPLRRTFIALAALGWATGCTTGTLGSPDGGDGFGSGAGPSAGIGGNASGVGGGGTLPGGTGGGAIVEGPVDCTVPGSDAVAAKRLVRLSFNQVANSIATLLSDGLRSTIVEEFELVDAQHRAFPPLQSPREGNSFTDQSWDAADRIAQAAGQYVLDNLAATTNCGEAPSDDCALSYLTDLAEKGYRRPLTADELTRFTGLYTSFKTNEATVPEAIQYGVYAIFQSPQFLYRTEFGTSTGALTQQELASLLSYFLTDDTPDDLLVAASERSELSNPDAVKAQVDRILTTDAAKANIEGAMISYFAYPNLEKQIIQDDAFDGDMRRSMYREAELFLQRSLWSGPVNSLLTSRKGFVDATLAPIYGFMTFPPPGAVAGPDSFYEVDLPANRTGLMTQAGFLANRSRPDHTSVVGRGLLIKAAFLCTETPAPSEGVLAIIEQLAETMPDASEREMAELRAETGACAECHHTFDAYGLALDTFDVLGRYREKDDHDRPIDPSVTLPEIIGGGEAKDVVEVAQKLASSGAFARCMGQNLINYALADVSAGAVNIESCAVKRLAEDFAASDGTFSSLVKVVATSAALSQRIQGEAQ